MVIGYKKTEIDNRNHNAFYWHFQFNPTDEQAYWLGWLASDGCLHKTRNKYWDISLLLKSSDKMLITRFAKFIGAKNIIYRPVSKGEGYQARISSEIMANRLIELGITERKSHSIKIHKSLENNALFWRGVFEGDGSINNKICNKAKDNYFRIELATASYEFAKQWCNFLNISETFIYVNKTRSCYKVLTQKQSEVLRVLKILYKDSTPELRLERKWEIVKRCIYLLDDSCLPGTFNLG
jgi:DNA-binding transcriptional regulator WhiA